MTATLALRALVTLLCALAVGGQAAQLRRLYLPGAELAIRLFTRTNPPFLGVLAMDSLVSLVAAGLALALVYRSSGERGARTLAVALASWAYLTAYAGLAVLLGPLREGLGRLGFEAHFLLVEFVGLAALVRFAAVFPRPLEARALADPASLPVGIRSLQALRRWLLEPAAPWLAALVGFALVLGLTGWTGRDMGALPAFTGAGVLRFAALTAVVLNLQHAYQTARGDDRNRVVWTMVGLALMMGCLVLIISANLLFAVTGWDIPGVNWRPMLVDLGVIGLFWGAAMAVFYEGTIRSAAAMRQATVFFGLASGTVLMAAGLEALFSQVLAARFSLPEGSGTVLALGILGISFAPARRLLRGLAGQLAGAPEETAG